MIVQTQFIHAVVLLDVALLIVCVCVYACVKVYVVEHDQEKIKSISERPHAAPAPSVPLF